MTKRKQFLARVSDVEAYRYCMDFDISDLDNPVETEEQFERVMEWMPTEERLLQGLKEGIEENDNMLIGTLGHKILEDTPPGQSCWYATDDDHQLGLYFGDVDLEVPFIRIREQRLFKTYQIGDYDFTLTGRFDARDYNKIVDYKFSGKLKFEKKYMNSFQWRAYLDLDGRADEFEYSVFQVFKMSNNPRFGPSPADLGLNPNLTNFRVANHVSYVCTKYPDLHDDVVAKITAFLAWSVDKGWEGRSMKEFENE